MRALLLLALLLAVRDGYACTFSRIIPDQLDGASDLEINQYFWKEDFDKADIVVLAKVKGIRETEASYLAEIDALAIFKSDSRPVQFLFDTYGNCKYAVEEGGTYVIFGHRTRGLLEHMQVATQPITPRFAAWLVELTHHDAPLNTDVVRYLKEQMVIWVNRDAQ